MKKVLFVGDAAVPSGFALATHNYLSGLDYREKGAYDCAVLGINYLGDPHPYPYPIYPCMPGGDQFGLGRLIWACDFHKPDVIIIQQDPWNFPAYLNKLKQPSKGYEQPLYKDVPVIGVVAVDGVNCMGKALNDLDHAIFWTHFGAQEARAGGYTKPFTVIPLGVSLSDYYPMPKDEARKELGLTPAILGSDPFIIGNVNRNQPRKRWDLTLRAFADFVKEKAHDNPWLFLHTAPTGDMGINVLKLADYYGITKHLMLRQPPVFKGVDIKTMRLTYNSFNVQMSTTQGEGFGLTTLEGMACGVDQIVPEWSGLADWARGGAYFVPCNDTAIGPPYVNVLGGVVDRWKLLEALKRAADGRLMADEHGDSINPLKFAAKSQFRWPLIASQLAKVVTEVVEQGARSTPV